MLKYLAANRRVKHPRIHTAIARVDRLSAPRQMPTFHRAQSSSYARNSNAAQNSPFPIFRYSSEMGTLTHDDTARANYRPGGRSLIPTHPTQREPVILYRWGFTLWTGSFLTGENRLLECFCARAQYASQTPQYPRRKAMTYISLRHKPARNSQSRQIAPTRDPQMTLV